MIMKSNTPIQTVKDRLAKLLATENITVRHSSKAKTASFDVKGRVLTLPIWKEMDVDLYDLLTGHEVGHALYTPGDEWEAAVNDGVNRNILNIVEDPRIERKVKGKYPGLIRGFTVGYRSLKDMGFFGALDPLEIRELNTLDRVNLHFKLGASYGIPFDESEYWVVDAVDSLTDFQSAVDLAKKLQIAYSSDMLMPRLDDHDFESGGFDNSDMDGEPIEMPSSDSDEDDGESPKQEETGENVDIGQFSADEHGVDSEDFETVEEFEQHLEDLSEDGVDYTYFGLPKAKLEEIIVPHKTVRREMGGILKTWFEKADADYGTAEGSHYYGASISRTTDMAPTSTNFKSEYNKFRLSSGKIINYMVKEFERKKAADEYKRTTVDKTGILNPLKLHSYQYNEDIFLKRGIVHDGKNHGMVMLLDWSASMTYHMEHTMKQIMNLVWFCNKVQIPFEVYAFTSCYHKYEMVEGEKRLIPMIENQWDYKPDDIYFGASDRFHLLNIVSSRMSAKDLNQSLFNLFSASMLWSKYYYKLVDFGPYSMGSTPLVEGLMAMQTVIPNFKNHYKLDKVNFICLTDGEGNSSMSKIFDPYREEGHGFKSISYRDNLIFEDPMTRKTYDLRNSQMRFRMRAGDEQAVFLAKILKERYNISTIGIYLDSSSKSLGRHLLDKYLGWYSYNKEDHKKARRECRESGFATITTAGYDEYYLIPTGNIELDTNTSLPIEDGAGADMTKGKLRTLFAKNQKRKFGNRVLANRMLDLIA